MSGIKSRPVYPGLSPDPNASSNLIVCDQGGAEAAIELFARADEEFARRSNVILVAEGMSPAERDAAVKRLAPTAVVVLEDIDTANRRLSAVLAAATMGLRLYAAGTEPLIGSVVKTGAEHFIDPFPSAQNTGDLLSVVSSACTARA